MIGRGLLVAAGAAALSSSAALAVDSLAEAFKESEALLELRLRQESVKQAGLAHDANALTSRLRSGLKTAPLAGTSLLAEAGIEDLFPRLSYAFGAAGPFRSLSVVAVYHDFGADYRSADYGAETDLSFVARIDRLALTLKYASYEADALFKNTDKAWLALDYSF